MMLSFAAALLAAGPTPQSVSAESQADGRCVAAFIALSEKADAADKPGLDASMMFFMGKIVGRAGKGALAAAVGAGAATLKEADTPQVAMKCAAEIEAASDAM